jgi:hypothetical protein
MWRIFLVHFISGIIGQQVDFKDGSLNWSISLNNAETISVTLKKDSLPTKDADTWLKPYWGGLLLMYNDVPVFVGPIINRPSETFDEIQIDCGSVRNILADRLAIPELSDWTQIASTTLHYDSLSLATIAKRLVQDTQNKPGGALPISYPVPDEPGPGGTTHERNYQGYNLTNIGVDKLLQDLSNVRQGPDIMFRPRILDSGRFTLDMWTGNSTNPRIPQSRICEWDTTAVKSDVVNLSIVSTGAYMTNRVYFAGAGTDAATKITMVQDLSDITSGYPLLETAYSDGTSENLDVLASLAQSKLDLNKGLLREISFDVRADGYNALGTFWPGDLVRIYTKGWVTLEDGYHDCRLLTMTGDSSQNVKLAMQTEDQFANGSTTP